MKSLLRLLRFALIGLIAGTLFNLALGLLWPAIFPGVVRPAPDSAAPLLSLLATISIVLVMTSLPALIGGMIGGVLPREGGNRQQAIFAAIGGIIASLPFACFNFWVMSGA